LSYTPLFVELIVIGIGTAIWLLLFAGALFRHKFEAKPLLDNKLFLALLSATVYVLGIVTDRQARDLFMPTIEAQAKHSVYTSEKIQQVKAHAPHLTEQNLSMELEKFIRANSEALAAKIDYNRSRLRICRSWILHFFLIGIGFLVWNVRVRVIDLKKTIVILAVDVVFVLLTLQTTIRLAEDHQKDLFESFNIILEAAKHKVPNGG